MSEKKKPYCCVIDGIMLVIDSQTDGAIIAPTYATENDVTAASIKLGAAWAKDRPEDKPADVALRLIRKNVDTAALAKDHEKGDCTYNYDFPDNYGYARGVSCYENVNLVDRHAIRDYPRVAEAIKDEVNADDIWAEFVSDIKPLGKRHLHINSRLRDGDAYSATVKLNNGNTMRIEVVVNPENNCLLDLSDVTRADVEETTLRR